MKLFSIVLFALLITFGSAFAQRGGDDRGIISISDLPEKSKALFDDVKTKFVKKEKAFAASFIQVTFATKATYKARYHAAAIHGGAKAEVSVELQGISDEVLQQIADQAAVIYEEKLLAAGLEVIPYSSLADNKGFAKIVEKSDPRRVETKIPALMKSSGTTHTKTFTAHDGPIYDGKAAGQLYKMQSKLKAGTIVSHFTINFSTFDKEKEWRQSYGDIIQTVSVEAIPVISMGNISTWISSKSKFGMLHQLKFWASDKDFLVSGEEMESGAFGMKVDPEAYKSACLELITKNIEKTVEHIRSLSK